MLVAAYATLRSSRYGVSELMAPLAILGMALSLVTFVINVYHYLYTSRPVWKQLRRLTPEYKEIDDCRIKFPASGALLGGVVPLLFCILWIYFLVN
jgi:hypothetical protein